jgi:hypothetical protein
MPTKVWIGTWTNRHGTGTYAGDSRAAVVAQIYEELKKGPWATEMGSEPIPEDPEEALSSYLDETVNDGETSIEIEELEIKSAPPKPLKEYWIRNYCTVLAWEDHRVMASSPEEAMETFLGHAPDRIEESTPSQTHFEVLETNPREPKVVKHDG